MFVAGVGFGRRPPAPAHRGGLFQRGVPWPLLVYTDNYNPLDYRVLPQNYGPHLVPAKVWNERNLLPYANFHDPGGAWWQWEPGGEFLRRALQRREWPWWDPYVGGGTPAMANLTQAFFFPPYLLLVALGNGVVLKNVYFLTMLLIAGFFTTRPAPASRVARCVVCGAAAVLLCGGLNQNVGSFTGKRRHACRSLLPHPLLPGSAGWRRAALLARAMRRSRWRAFRRLVALRPSSCTRRQIATARTVYARRTVSGRRRARRRLVVFTICRHRCDA